jgi:hypothetical protein
MIYIYLTENILSAGGIVLGLSKGQYRSDNRCDGGSDMIFEAMESVNK